MQNKWLSIEKINTSTDTAILKETEEFFNEIEKEKNIAAKILNEIEMEHKRLISKFLKDNDELQKTS